MDKLFVGICNSQDYLPSDFFWSVVNQKDCGMELIFRRFKSSSTCIRNNKLIRDFLKSSCDYLVRMDIDQVYPPDYFRVMVPLVETYKAIGPLIFDRQIENNFIPLVTWLEQYPNHWDIRQAKGIIQVPYSHTNYFFHRSVLEGLSVPYFEEHLTKDGFQRENMDRAFTQKIVANGHKLFVNLDMVVDHIANISVGRSFYERWNYDTHCKRK